MESERLVFVDITLVWQRGDRTSEGMGHEEVVRWSPAALTAGW